MKETARHFLERHSVVLKLLFSLSLLVYCISLIDLQKLRQIDIRWHWIIFGLVLVLVDNLVGAVRFKTLLDSITRIGLLAHIRYYFWASFFNSALPSSIGGDAMRMIWLKNHAVSVKLAVSLVVLERIFGVFTLILIAAIAAMALNLPPSLASLLLPVCLVVAVGGLGALVLLVIFRKARLLRQAIDNLVVVFANFRRIDFFVLFALSVLYQAITIAISICAGMSIGLELSLAIWFFIVPLVWLVTVVPISLGGLGIREISFVVLLAALGQANEQAVLLGLLTFLIHLLGGLIGGGWYVSSSNRAG